MLEKFLIFVEDEVDEKIANAYLNRATNTILKLTNRRLEDIDEGLEDVIVDLAVYRYQRRNSIAYNSESYSGASFNYNNDIPDFIMQEIKGYRKLRVF